MKIKPLHNIIILLTSYTVGCSAPFQVQINPQEEAIKKSANCFQRTESSEACLFEKSPMVQAGMTLAADYWGSQQSYPVTIQDTILGKLENGHFSVQTSRTHRIPESTNFRYYYNPTHSYLEQISAYYFTNELRKWLTIRGMTLHHGQNFKIIADSSFNGFVPSQKEIHLERNGLNLPSALDGSIVQNLYAQAAIWSATSGQSHVTLDATAKDCNDAQGFNAKNFCCKNQDGCAAAAINGVADFLTASYFSNITTRIGEGIKNDLQGLSVCGINRDPSSNTNLNAIQAYKSCESRSSSGNIISMGSLYASIWWQALQQSNHKLELEKLFVKHLEILRGEDTFLTLKNKIIDLDTLHFSSKNKTVIEHAFSAKGY